MPKGGHPPHHSITSSVVASRAGGTSRPSGLRAFHIVHQLELDRRLDRQLGGPLATENAVDIGRRAPNHIKLLGAVGYEPASQDRLAKDVDRGDAIAGRGCGDQLSIARGEGVGRDEQSAASLAREHFDLASTSLGRFANDLIGSTLNLGATLVNTEK